MADQRRARRKLREFRKAHDLSRAELARHLGCDRSYVSLIERGKRNAGLRFATGLAALMRAFGDEPIDPSEWAVAA